MMQGFSGESYVLPIDLATSGLCFHRLSVAPRDVVFIKGVLEASDGLANVFAIKGGELWVATTAERERELVEALGDLVAECSGARWLTRDEADRATNRATP